MKSRTLIAMFAVSAGLSALSTASAQPAASPALAADTVVLQAGEFTLTKDQYERLGLGFERGVGAVMTGANAQSPQSGAEVARLLALVSEAQRRKLDQTPRMQELIRVRSYVLMANALLQALVQEARADEAGTRALWESEKNNYIDVVARQVLVRYNGVTVENARVTGLNRSDAQALVVARAAQQKLAAGADFAAIAKASSDDEATRLKGGQLPAFTRGATQAEFESVAFTLPVGTVSEPFKTKYGYHVIQVTERRPYPFERVRSSLEFVRAQQRMEELGAKGVELNGAYFKS